MERLERLGQSLADFEVLLNQTEEQVERCSERLIALRRSRASVATAELVEGEPKQPNGAMMNTLMRFLDAQ